MFGVRSSCLFYSYTLMDGEEEKRKRKEIEYSPHFSGERRALLREICRLGCD